MVRIFFYVSIAWSKIRCVLVSCLLVYIMNSWSRVLEQQPIVIQLVKKFSVIYGIKKFCTISLEVSESSCEPARSVHSMV